MPLIGLPASNFVRRSRATSPSQGMGPFRFYCGVLPTLPLLRRPLPRGIGGLAQGIPAQGQIHQLGQPGRHFSEHAAGLGVLPKQFF